MNLQDPWGTWEPFCPGDTALRTMVGWNIEIMFMFSIMGVIYYHSLDENKETKIFGIPDMWFLAIIYSAFSVLRVKNDEDFRKELERLASCKVGKKRRSTCCYERRFGRRKKAFVFPTHIRIPLIRC